MKIKFNLLLLIGLCTGQLLAQGWERVYELEDQQIPISAGFSADGNIQFAGHNGQFGTDLFPERFEYLKVNLDGDTLRYHSEFRDDKTMSDVVFTQDGGMLITGHTNDPTEPPYVMKLDDNFNEEWTLVSGSLELGRNSVAETADGDFYFVGVKLNFYTDGMGTTDSIGFRPWVKKVDMDGNLLFTIFYDEFTAEDAGFLHSYRAIATSDGGAMVTYDKLEDGDNSVQLIKIDPQGQMEWSKEYNFYGLRDIIQVDNGDYIMVGNRWTPSTNFDVFMQRVDAQGNILWMKTQSGFEWDYGKSITPTLDGNYYVAGDLVPTANGQLFIFLTKISPQGDIIWTHTYDNRGRSSIANEVMTAADGGAYIAGVYANILNQRDFYLIKTDTNGVSLSNEVLGTVFHDLDQDCAPDPLTEMGLPGWVVNLDGGANQNFYAYTNDFGSFSIPAQEGNYDLSARPPSPYWLGCQFDYPVVFDMNNFETETVDIPFRAVIDCPYMEVSIGNWALRPCLLTNYTVGYCNHGTIAAEDAYVEVVFDDSIFVNAASIPYTEMNGVYTFELDTVQVAECGSFTIEVMLACDATLGLTYCAEAHIYPDSICLPTTGWSGASIEAEADCVDGDIVFTLKNVGTATTTQKVDYFVVEDDVILYHGNVEELLVGEIETLPAITGMGSTYRLEVRQEPNHPGMNNPSIVIEGCTNNGPPVSTGFVSIFPEGDGDPFVDVECIQATGSYDPNDKQGIPLGVGDEHIIEPGQAIEYKIRFQNVGTDTAFNVVILDTLSEMLNGTTIRPGVSSHPYEFNISGNGILEFRFNNIQLPDSTTNELGSQGFVKFRINQAFSLPLGTVIENSAAIYFDFNDPVITNTTMHTVDELFDWSVGIEEPPLVSSNWQVQPNPFLEETVFVGKDYTGGFPLQLQVYDALGRLQRAETITQDNWTFKRESLAEGLYYYQLNEQGKNIASGKLLIQ